MVTLGARAILVEIHQNDWVNEFYCEGEQAMLEFGARLASIFDAGDVVLFVGELGAGKTTLIRGWLHELGWKESVRSPTFNLFAVYPTNPPVLHADLYRLTDAQGTGIEDYLETHLSLIEWPLALSRLLSLDELPLIRIGFEGEGRRITLENFSLPVARPSHKIEPSGQ